MRLQKTRNFILRRGHKSCNTKFSRCKLERAKLKRKRSSDSTETSSRGKGQRLNSEVCFLVWEGSSRRWWRAPPGVYIWDRRKYIRAIITELNDSRLLVRIVGGDLIAIGAKYLLKHLIELKNRYSSHVRTSNKGKQNIDENVCTACLSSLQVMSKKLNQNSCLNCRSCTLYMKVACRI